MGDINCGISSSSIVSFADDTRSYHGISDSECIFRRTLLGYYVEGKHTNFKENLI